MKKIISILFTKILSTHAYDYMVGREKFEVKLGYWKDFSRIEGGAILFIRMKIWHLIYKTDTIYRQVKSTMRLYWKHILYTASAIINFQRKLISFLIFRSHPIQAFISFVVSNWWLHSFVGLIIISFNGWFECINHLRVSLCYMYVLIGIEYLHGISKPQNIFSLLKLLWIIRLSENIYWYK